MNTKSLIWTMLLILLLFQICESKKKNKKYQTHKIKKDECAKGECNHLTADIADNCVNKCISVDCYEKIYGRSPLEFGEIDNRRNKSFMECVREEIRQLQKKPNN
jgi:hypothetical protein